MDNEVVGGVKGCYGSVYGWLPSVYGQFVEEVEGLNIEGNIEKIEGTELEGKEGGGYR